MSNDTPVTMKAPASTVPGSDIILFDGSTVTIDLKGYVIVAAKFVTVLMNSGYSLVQSDIASNEGE